MPKPYKVKFYEDSDEEKETTADAVVGPLVPSVPEPDGNNVSSGSKSLKVSPKYKYDFVINNYTEDEVCQLFQVIPIIAKKAICAKEVGENGTPHIQAYISLKKKERITGLMNKYPKCFGRASFRVCRNEPALIEYCKKDGNIFINIGFPKPIQIIQELRPWQLAIEKLFFQPVNDRKIYWFWETVGGVGKSSFVKYMVVKHLCLFCDGGKKSDLINLVFNNNMDECRCIIWDIPRSTKGSISYATLESVKNGLICNTKYETGIKAFNPPHIFVFANFPPDKPEELSVDRWEIYNLELDTIIF